MKKPFIETFWDCFITIFFAIALAWVAFSIIPELSGMAGAAGVGLGYFAKKVITRLMGPPLSFKPEREVLLAMVAVALFFVVRYFAL